MSNIITTGDDISLPVTLKKNGATFSISSGATVRARLVALNHEATYSPVVTCSSSAPGADWANSLVVVAFGSTDTAGITYQGRAKVEVEVNDGGRLSWFAEVVIRRGNIA